MRTTITLQEAVLGKMDDSLDVQRGMSGKMDQQLEKIGNLEAKTEIGMRATLKKMNEQLRQMKSMDRATREAMSRSIDLQKQVVDGIEKEKPAKIDEVLTRASAIVRSPKTEENHYRIAAAMSVYEVLLRENLGSHWYKKFVAGNIKMCAKRVTETYGNVCTNIEHGKGGPDTTYQTGKRWTTKVREWTEGAVVDVSKFLKILDWVPFNPLSINAVWALALNPTIIPKLSEYIAEDEVDVQSSKVHDFLRFSRDFMIQTMGRMANDEEKHHAVPTFVLGEFARRKRLAEIINALPQLHLHEVDVAIEHHTDRLVDAVQDRSGPLSPQVEAILRRL